MKIKDDNKDDIDRILQRSELQKKVIEKMIEKVNGDYEKQKIQIKKNKIR